MMCYVSYTRVARARVTKTLTRAAKRLNKPHRLLNRAHCSTLCFRYRWKANVKTIINEWGKWSEYLETVPLTLFIGMWRCDCTWPCFFHILVAFQVNMPLQVYQHTFSVFWGVVWCRGCVLVGVNIRESYTTLLIGDLSSQRSECKWFNSLFYDRPTLLLLTDNLHLHEDESFSIYQWIIYISSFMLKLCRSEEFPGTANKIEAKKSITNTVLKLLRLRTRGSSLVFFLPFDFGAQRDVIYFIFLLDIIFFMLMFCNMLNQIHQFCQSAFDSRCWFAVLPRVCVSAQLKVCEVFGSHYEIWCVTCVHAGYIQYRTLWRV